MDYADTLIGGRAVFLEAKYTRAEQMEQSRIADRQAEAMDAHTALGASCGVLVTFSLARCGLVLWAAWRRMKEIFGRKYIKAEDLTKMGWEFSLFDPRGLCQHCMD
ncbi:MAG: Holliday junction resolvase RecU [Akkermansia sp.]|nr:Holliday junction resolvase RecU [Akkermansia sp.]